MYFNKRSAIYDNVCGGGKRMQWQDNEETKEMTNCCANCTKLDTCCNEMFKCDIFMRTEHECPRACNPCPEFENNEVKDVR